MTRLYHPMLQPWHDHFAWSDDVAILVGLTPAGRATIALLRMNRPVLVQMRRYWIALGCIRLASLMARRLISVLHGTRRTLWQFPSPLQRTPAPWAALFEEPGQALLFTCDTLPGRC